MIEGIVKQHRPADGEIRLWHPLHPLRPTELINQGDRASDQSNLRFVGERGNEAPDARRLGNIVGVHARYDLGARDLYAPVRGGGAPEVGWVDDDADTWIAFLESIEYCALA